VIALFTPDALIRLYLISMKQRGFVIVVNLDGNPLHV
jgi:hypothetical protein